MKVSAVKSESGPVVLLNKGREQWQQCCDCFKQFRRGDQAEAVHELRISLRQWMAMMEWLQAVYILPSLPAIMVQTKVMLKQFSAVRDAQVLHDLLGQIKPQDDALEAAQSRLRKKEKRLTRKLEKSVGKPWRMLKKQSRALLEECATATIRSSARKSFQTVVIQQLQRSWGKVVEQKEVCSVLTAENIHSLRVALKGFRYLAIFAQPFLIDRAVRHLNSMRQQQSFMGSIHDWHILQEFANAQAKKRGRKQLPTFLRIAAQAQTRMKLEMSKFKRVMPKINYEDLLAPPRQGGRH